jgi:hypothetical protein
VKRKAALAQLVGYSLFLFSISSRAVSFIPFFIIIFFYLSLFCNGRYRPIDSYGVISNGLPLALLH